MEKRSLELSMATYKLGSSSSPWGESVTSDSLARLVSLGEVSDCRGKNGALRPEGERAGCLFEDVCVF